MSREIKFRAWLKPRWEDDEDSNKMYYDIQNSYDNLGDVKPFDPMNSFANWLDNEVAIIEQCTGLTDKNGQEIYDGDIVEEDIDFNSKMTDGTFRYKVYWNEDELCWSLDPIGPESIHHELWETNSSRRVIGNIHENKEEEK